MYPLTFIPVLKNYIWGGRNLAEKLGRPLPSGIVAESWDIAAHPDGITVVANGAYAGTSLTDLQKEWGLALVGQRGQWAHERGKFPLLIKLLDAAAPLSVQVHPDDAYALAHEGNELGKAEMWVVLHAEPNAQIILGLSQATTPQTFRQAISHGQVEPLLHHIQVKTGDVVCVPARSLHAILGGLLIAEIQQNSNTTYRVYDWNRLDNQGKSRPLHIQKAIDVIAFDQVQPQLVEAMPSWQQGACQAYRLCANRYFVTERVEMPAHARYTGQTNGETLEIWGTIAGTATLSSNGVDVAAPAVQFALLPAGMGQFHITTHTPTTLLRTFLPS